MLNVTYNECNLPYNIEQYIYLSMLKNINNILELAEVRKKHDKQNLINCKNTIYTK